MMKKKAYTSPETRVISIEVQQLVCSSVLDVMTGEADGVALHIDDDDYEGDGLVRGYNTGWHSIWD